MCLLKHWDSLSKRCQVTLYIQTVTSEGRRLVGWWKWCFKLPGVTAYYKPHSMERCYWTVVLKYVFDAARYHGGAADRSSLLGCDAVLLWKYFWMFWMVTVPTCSESSSPIRKGCVTVKMKALWPFEMMRTPDWHSTTWIVSCSTEETSNLVVW